MLWSRRVFMISPQKLLLVDPRYLPAWAAYRIHTLKEEPRIGLCQKSKNRMRHLGSRDVQQHRHCACVRTKMSARRYFCISNLSGHRANWMDSFLANHFQQSMKSPVSIVGTVTVHLVWPFRASPPKAISYKPAAWHATREQSSLGVAYVSGSSSR
jgi:hypothetical protein